MNRIIFTLALSAVFASPAIAADEPPQASAASEAAATEYARVAEDAERARAEAERARAEASRVAERAREAARMRERAVREMAEQSQAQSAEMQRERDRQEAEIERAREELSRAHRELREAQREVAQAHRELARNTAFAYTTRVVNLGDKPVIGVVLGEKKGNGIELVGVKAGDVLLAIKGRELAGADDPRAVVFEVMETVEAGDTVDIEVEREEGMASFGVVAEVREPASWQSLVRIPEIRTVKRIEGGPGEHTIVIDSTVVPEIDSEALNERMEILREKLADTEIHIQSGSTHTIPGLEWHGLEGDYSFEFEEFSELGDHALSSANVWFGLPLGHGVTRLGS